MTLDFYNQNANSFFESTVNVDMSSFHSRFLSLVKPGGRILDAGCGSGRDAKIFKDLGYLVSAFDASEELVKLAREYSGVDVQVNSFSQFGDQDIYDGIWACASLLHVPTTELPKAIDNLWNALRLNGVLYLNFKLGDKECMRGDRFFTDMNESSLTDLLRNYASPFDIWVTKDQRPDREEYWVNGLFIKT